MKKTLIIIIVIFATALCILIVLYRVKMKENKRLGDNQRTLLTDIAFYRTKDSLSVTNVERHTLNNNEFRKYNEDLKKTIDKLNLKVKRLQSVSQTAVKTEYIVNTVFKDSIVYVDSKPDTLRCIAYEDAYLTFAGCEKMVILPAKSKAATRWLQWFTAYHADFCSSVGEPKPSVRKSQAKIHTAPLSTPNIWSLKSRPFNTFHRTSFLITD